MHKPGFDSLFHVIIYIYMLKTVILPIKLNHTQCSFHSSRRCIHAKNNKQTYISRRVMDGIPTLALRHAAALRKTDEQETDWQRAYITGLRMAAGLTYVRPSCVRPAGDPSIFVCWENIWWREEKKDQRITTKYNFPLLAPPQKMTCGYRAVINESPTKFIWCIGHNQRVLPWSIPTERRSVFTLRISRQVHFDFSWSINTVSPLSSYSCPPHSFVFFLSFPYPSTKFFLSWP